jgi:DNA-binding response OmpR family regulator
MDGSKILIIENERIVAEDIKRRLQSESYHVTAIVDSIIEANKEISLITPQLIIMDYFMSGCTNGKELIRTIVTRDHIPIIFLVAHEKECIFMTSNVQGNGGTVNVQGDTLIGLFDCVVKPFDDEILKSSVRYILQESEHANSIGNESYKAPNTELDDCDVRGNGA